MTQEEISKVLELALEYYKLEIFGTGKESQPPTQERIDYIYDHMQSYLPANLDDAEFEYVQSLDDIPVNQEEDKMIYDAFKAGAKWMAGQGETVTGIITKVGDKLDVETTEYLIPEESEFERGDRVIVQIRKKQ